MKSLIVSSLALTAAWAQTTIAGSSAISGSVTSSNVIIESVAAQSISLTGAAIVWSTSVPSVCHVDYGVTSSYGSTSADTVMNASILTGLAQGAAYQYRVNCGTSVSQAMSFSTLSQIAYSTPRTLIDNEYAQYASISNSNPYSTLGALMNVPMDPSNFASLSHGTKGQELKLWHGLILFSSGLDTRGFSWLNEMQLATYDADEVASGRPSLFMKALDNTGTAHVPLYYQASTNNVNVSKYCYFAADPRYVRFFVNQYVRATIHSPVLEVTDSPYLVNSIMSSDEGNLSSTYCSGNNNWIQTNPVAWDWPYPQTDTEYGNMVVSFFAQVRRYGHDADVILNEGSIPNRNLDYWAAVFGSLAGIDREGGPNIPETSEFLRGQWSSSFQHWVWLMQDRDPDGNGKIWWVRQQTDGTAGQAVQGALYYLIVKNGNSFFEETTGTADVPSTFYEPVFNALGKQSGMYIQGPQIGANSWDSLYSRTFEGGIVFLNWTGSVQTIPLPAGTWYQKGTGSPVTSITLVDGVLDYVTSKSGTFAAMPQYYPPTTGGVLTGPVTITLSDRTSGTSIYYTTDGSTPNCSSALYAGPFSISATTTIKAVACKSGINTSFVKSVTYLIHTAVPTINFSIATDGDSEFWTKVYPGIKLSNATPDTVTVNYTVRASAGLIVSPASGTVTFQPFQTIMSPLISVAKNSGVTTQQTVTVTLTSATNATIGALSVYTYTVTPYTFSNKLYYVELRPTQCAYLQSGFPSATGGTGDYYYVGHTTGPSGDYRTLWQYDLSAIPSNATISYAQIRSHSSNTVDGSGSGDINLAVYRMLVPWTQTRATWNNSGGLPTNYAATPSTNNSILCPSLATPPPYSIQTCGYWDVTGDVQNIVNGTYPNNYGWLFVGPEASSNPKYANQYCINQTDSQNNHVLGFATTLLIRYTLP